MSSSSATSLALPERIFAIASPRSIGGVSMFDAQAQIRSHNVANVLSDEEISSRAVMRLQDAGFEVLQVTPTAINIAGNPALYGRAFATELFVDQRQVIKPGAQAAMAEFIDTQGTDISGLISTAGTQFDDLLEGVAIEEPRYYMAPPAFPPTKQYWHLDVPAGVSLGCNADRAHRSGITGKGVKIAMVDSGHYAHPFFDARGYRVSPVVLAPGATNVADDEVGHGTGESANIFAVAPDIELHPVKMSFVNTKAAFDAAVGLGPDIITCSWGSSNRFGPLSAADQALAASIALAVASGIIVVFSAGNGHWGFPGQHPDVISAGGAFMEQDGTMTASNYASGFMSNIYPNRRVPDLCGLIGLMPKAIYIMLPVQGNDEIDTGNAGGTFPNGDETQPGDGWAAFSGTSAAAPQLAGAAALVKQACSRLTPAQVRDVLTSTARDVTTGTCNSDTGGNAAGPGPDLATGNGLVDAERATLVAKLRCLGPIQPIQPIQPVQPVRPIGPITPVRPIRPIEPIGPIRPIRPIQPIDPGPLAARSTQPMAGAASTEASAGEGQVPPPSLSAEDVQRLEALAERGDLGLRDVE